MSLSWLDRVTLLVHPHQVVLQRRPWRGADRCQVVAVGSGGPAGATGAPWAPALAAVEAALAADGRPGGSLSIVVADHFVRYALLPWSPDLVGRKARQAMALALLRHNLGDQAGNLEIALDRPVFGRNGIAAGIDRDLLGALRARARAARLRIASLQPRLIRELAAGRKHLTGNDGWFACVDRERVSLLAVHAGAVASLRNHRLATADPDALGRQLAGLLAASGPAPAGQRLWLCTGGPRLPDRLPGDWVLSPWPSLLNGPAHA